MTNDENIRGPWEVVERSGRVWIEGVHKSRGMAPAGDAWPLVASIPRDYAPDLARARLIAAAPSLLTALRDAASKCPECEGVGTVWDGVSPLPPAVCPTCREWRAAIKQAEGDTGP